MRIFRNIIAIAIAVFLISNIDQASDDRLAAASEETVTIPDHSTCEATIAARDEEILILSHQLEEARRTADLTLRVELEFVSGFFGDWARVSFRSAPIRISAAAAEGLSEGDDLCQGMLNDSSFLDWAIDCRIIVESVEEST